MIDVTKPLELADGTPVTFVKLRGDVIQGRIGGDAALRHFDAITGEHLYGYLTKLRNVVLGPTVGQTRQLRYRNEQELAQRALELSGATTTMTPNEILDFILYKD